jgi:hypothetical protein
VRYNPDKNYALGQKLSKEAADADTAGSIFDLFFDDKMIELIVKFTNRYKIFILTILSVSDLDPHSCALILLSWILIRIIVQYLTFFFVPNAESWKAL